MANSRMRLISKILCLGFVLIMGLGILCACDKEDNFRNPKNGEPTSGEFYTLQVAYDNGWLSKGDLRNIAYYYAGDAQKKGFKPTPKIPETLSHETELAIRESNLYSRWDDSKVAIDDIVIRGYYGEYNGLIAVIVHNNSAYYPAVVYEVTVGGIKFSFGSPGTVIELWKKPM